MKNYATYLLVAVLLGFTAYNCTWTKTKAKDVYVSAVENYVKTVERDGASFSYVFRSTCATYFGLIVPVAKQG